MNYPLRMCGLSSIGPTATNCILVPSMSGPQSYETLYKTALLGLLFCVGWLWLVARYVWDVVLVVSEQVILPLSRAGKEVQKRTVSAWQCRCSLIAFFDQGNRMWIAMFVCTWIANEMKFVRSLGLRRTLHCNLDITKFMLIRTLERPSNDLP